MFILISLALATAPSSMERYGKRCTKDPEGARNASAELAELARLTLEAPVASTTDEHARRLKRVHKLAKGYLCDRAAFRDAALVLVSSTSPRDLDLAASLAQEAAKEGLDRAHWAFTQAFDRALVARGLPQSFGTQFGAVDGDARACMYPVDPSFTDEERKAWSVPPLAEQIAAYLAERGHPGEPPTAQTLRRLNLMCLNEAW